MNKITLDINNNKIMTISQDKHDGEITLTTEDSNLSIGGTWTISQGDFVMLMNYYRVQKEKGEPIF